MFERKLKALKFSNPTSFNVHDEGQFRHLIGWLEDSKIRHYKPEDRQMLKDFQSEHWDKTFSLVYGAKYLIGIGCPYKTNDDKIVVMDWVLGHAVRLDYADNIDALKALTVERIQEDKKNSSVSSVTSSNPLDRLDFQSEFFKKSVQDLARILKIPQHPDHLVMLKAICHLVSERLSVVAVQNAESQKKMETHGASAVLQDYELGFSTHDAMLDDACKIVRLLHVQNMRELQTSINETIVAVQNLTANPKTDDKLGKVGFG